MDISRSVPAALPLTPRGKDMPPPPCPLTVHGSGLSEGSVLAILSREEETRLLPLSAGLLLLIFGFAAAGLAISYVGYVEGTFLLALLPVMLGVMLVGRRYRQNAAAKQQQRKARLYAAAVAGGVTTTAYADRMEQHSYRVRRTVCFTETTVFVETCDYLLVQNEDAWIAVAAADVTPWEAQAMFEVIAEVIPPARRFSQGEFMARRVQPAPPPFCGTPLVCYERVEYREEASRGIAWPAGTLPWLFAAALGTAGMFTVLFAMTGSFFLDFLLIFTACFAGCLAATVAVLLYQNGAAAHDVVLSFTSEGLLIEQAGRQDFVGAADVYARRTENGVKLFTPAGAFVVPWSLTKNRQQLEWMLFSQRPSSR